MGPKHDLVNIVRKTQTLVSVLLFVIVFLFFWTVTDFELKEIQLSYWGGNDVAYGWIWNSIIVLLSISILFNNIFFIKKNERIKKKILPYILFSFVALCLFIVGFFNLEYSIHTVAAYLYFFIYPLAIFVTAYINRTSLIYKEWLKHLLFSISMIIIPLTLITSFNGLAISELVHSLIICIWNLNVAFKRFDLI